MTQFAYPVTSENPTGAPFPMLKASGTVERDYPGGIVSIRPFGDAPTLALWRVHTDLHDDVGVSAIATEPVKTRGQEVAEKMFAIATAGSDMHMSVKMKWCDDLLWHSADEWIMRRRLGQMRKAIASIIDAERADAAKQATEDAAERCAAKSCMMA